MIHVFESLTSVNVTRTSPSFFASADGLCFWPNVNGLFHSIEIPCIPKDWRFFIVSSSRSLKDVLHQNGNRYPSIPLAHSMHLEENYTNVKTLLIVLKCDQLNWQVIGDFRMAAFLMGRQGGFRNFHVTFAIGIVETQLYTTTDEYDQNELNILLGTPTSNGTL